MEGLVPANNLVPFDPVRVREIIVAFDEACSSLPKQPVSDTVRAILVDRIMELAEHGEWDRATLRDEALHYLKTSTPT